MTPLLAVALLVLLGILGLWLLGESRTLVGTGGRCWMCRYSFWATDDGINRLWCDWRNSGGEGGIIYPDKYACIYYRRKWWLIWCSREAPGSGN